MLVPATDASLHRSWKRICTASCFLRPCLICGALAVFSSTTAITRNRILLSVSGTPVAERKTSCQATVRLPWQQSDLSNDASNYRRVLGK